MPTLRRLDLPTGMSITLGCAWPGVPARDGRGAGDAGVVHGRGAGMRAQAEARAGTDGVEKGGGADEVRAVGGQADP